MLKSVLIALSTAAAVTFSAGTEANAFGLASAARMIAPKPVAVQVQARQSDIACAESADGCHRGRTFLLTYDARIRNLLVVQTGSGEAVVDSLRRELVVRQISGNLFAANTVTHFGGKAPALRLG
ncbi:hypothetical protein [Rhizobium sp. C4]|uniref:hypothetical protein n=1 Tax=Rhizobium sp. C4 TaxID=1349800 RepID=UPI001E37A420|nr:hypothetical protein [Rhizobium sp. C4]MCD2174877.1 hypothetical protein [Rhizobium sp. C4]